jgi:hypothetical protein
MAEQFGCSRTTVLNRFREQVGHKKKLNIQYRTRNIQYPRQEKHKNMAQLAALPGNVCIWFPMFGWIFLVGCWILKSLGA